MQDAATISYTRDEKKSEPSCMSRGCVLQASSGCHWQSSGVNAAPGAEQSSGAETTIFLRDQTCGHGEVENRNTVLLKAKDNHTQLQQWASPSELIETSGWLLKGTAIIRNTRL